MPAQKGAPRLPRAKEEESGKNTASKIKTPTLGFFYPGAHVSKSLLIIQIIICFNSVTPDLIFLNKNTILFFLFLRERIVLQMKCK